MAKMSRGRVTRRQFRKWAQRQERDLRRMKAELLSAVAALIPEPQEAPVQKLIMQLPVSEAELIDAGLLPECKCEVCQQMGLACTNRALIGELFCDECYVGCHEDRRVGAGYDEGGPEE